jgi:SulP family sulfate permease
MTLVGPAFTIALLGAIESLLSATAADGLAGTRHNPNQELVGQGIANIFTPLLGGFAATGAIARTATNIRNGGNNFIAALVHSLLLLVIVVLLAPLAEYIPLCSLAAILFVVSYNMSDIPHVGYILRHAPRDDRIILVVTFLLTVFTNLVTAVEIGVILAMLFFMRKMTATSQVSESLATELLDESGGEVNFGADVLVYTVNGPLFFGVAEKFVETLSATHTKANAVIFKLQTVPFVDTSGLSSFQEAIEKLHKHRVRVYLYGVNPLIEQKFAEIGLLKLVAGQKSFNSLRDIAKEEAKS